MLKNTLPSFPMEILNISKEALNVFESDAFLAQKLCHSEFCIIKEFGKGVFIVIAVITRQLSYSISIDLLYK